jgi:hypothetical protein
MENRHAYTLTDAARILGTSEGALRQRIRRGSLESYKEHGRVYVYLPRTDNVQVSVHTPESQTLISEIQERVELLEQELERAHERDRETRRLLAAALERIPPQLEAPQETPNAPETTEYSSNSYSKQQEAELAAEREERRHREEVELTMKRMDLEEGGRQRQAELAMELEERRGRRQIALGLLGALTATVVGFLGTVISAGGESFGSTISSVVSAINGDQAVTIVSALIGLAGTVGAAYLTVRLTRRGTGNR